MKLFLIMFAPAIVLTFAAIVLPISIWWAVAAWFVGLFVGVSLAFAYYDHTRPEKRRKTDLKRTWKHDYKRNV
jgi:O-antigen/teichoic acid export membrane protein